MHTTINHFHNGNMINKKPKLQNINVNYNRLITHMQ